MKGRGAREDFVARALWSLRDHERGDAGTDLGPSSAAGIWGDDYLAYCAELGTEPYICLNMGTGTLEEALAWVEYCNSAGDAAV